MKASATVSTAAVAGMVTKMSERAPHPDEQAREWYDAPKKGSRELTIASLSALLSRVRQQALEEAARYLETNHRDDEDAEWTACCNLPDRIRSLCQADGER